MFFLIYMNIIEYKILIYINIIKYKIDESNLIYILKWYIPIFFSLAAVVTAAFNVLTGGRRVVESENESEDVQYRARDGRFVRGFGSHPKPRRRLGSSARSRIASYGCPAGMEWNSLERWILLCAWLGISRFSHWFRRSPMVKRMFVHVSGLIARDDSMTQRMVLRASKCMEIWSVVM
jgi:hypothetical protein